MQKVEAENVIKGGHSKRTATLSPNGFRDPGIMLTFRTSRIMPYFGLPAFTLIGEPCDHPAKKQQKVYFAF